jgi:hypothetical protein
MKTITIITILIFTLFGCKKDCPECYSFAASLRLGILNFQGENLLDPNNINRLDVDGLTLESGQKIDFEINDYSISTIHSGFWHIESIDEDFFNSCIDKEGEFYITYKNSTDIDTINVLIETETIETNGCKCTGYPLRYYKHNNIIITEYENEHTGSAIIRK